MLSDLVLHHLVFFKRLCFNLSNLCKVQFEFHNYVLPIIFTRAKSIGKMVKPATISNHYLAIKNLRY
uniref:Putative ovule protein n=1 Tax=Solanum chacoense TaxID=4108 RepID=A0A0V0H5H0_SOLCH